MTLLVRLFLRCSFVFAIETWFCVCFDVLFLSASVHTWCLCVAWVCVSVHALVTVFRFFFLLYLFIFNLCTQTRDSELSFWSNHQRCCLWTGCASSTIRIGYVVTPHTHVGSVVSTPTRTHTCGGSFSFYMHSHTRTHTLAQQHTHALLVFTFAYLLAPSSSNCCIDLYTPCAHY